MSQVLTFSFISTKLLFRSKDAAFWNFIFPVALFVLYVTVFSGMYPDNIPRERGIADNFSKILAITLMSGGLFFLAIAVATMKEKGILRRYKVAPVRPITIVSGLVVRQIIFLFAITAVLYLIAILAYHADFAGSIIDLVVITLIGIFVFSTLGFCVAGISKNSQAAVGIANLLFMPMLFLSGAAIPAFLFPQWLKDFAKVLPATHLLNLMQEVLFKGNPLNQEFSSILILLGFGVVFLILAGFTSRWN